MTDYQALKDQLERLSQELGRLGEVIGIATASDEPPRPAEWPQLRDRYWYVSDHGELYSDYWDKHAFDFARQQISIFRTKEEAELHKLRLESMAKRWKPALWENHWYWNFNKQKASSDQWTGYTSDLACLAMGNVHKTAAEAQAWGEKYGAAWAALWADEGGRD